MNNSSRTMMVAALAALSFAASPAAAQAAKPEGKAAAKHETEAQLKAEAKISMADAKKTALAQVPKGTVKAGELEREGGKLLYSFDIVTKGKSGIDEVQIDAITGAVLSNKHETPAMEKAEGKADKKEAKAKAMEAKHDVNAMKKP
jgi:uncharacterized membrane protein YkoI